MTSRERLLAALRRETPDRMPVTIYEYCPYNDDWPTREPSYAPLLDLERTLGDSFVFAPVEMPVFYNAAAVRRKTTPQSDGSLLCLSCVETPKGPLRWVRRRDPGLMTWWQIEPAIKCPADVDRLLSLPDPDLHLDASALRALESRTADDGVLCLNPGDALGRVVDLFDFSDFVLRCHRDDGPVRALLDRANAQLIAAITAIGQHIQQAAVRLWGPEYCGAPLMNPRRFFPRYVVEPDRELTRAIHAVGGFSIIHCHGRLRDLLDLIPEIGADALEPLETLPVPTADTTLPEVIARLSDHMCLMGGVQARTLETAPAVDVKREVEDILSHAADVPGFVVLPTAAPFMLPLAPRCLKNLEAMYRTVHGQPLSP